MYYASDFRRKAREALRGNWGLAIGTGLVAVLLGGTDFTNRNNSRINYNDVASNAHVRYDYFYFSLFLGVTVVIISLILIALLIGGTIEIGYSRFNLNLINADNPKFIDLFSAFSIFWKGFLMRLLTGVYTFLWSLLLIIPGIIASISYTMTPYILCENKELSVSEAISMSKDMMMGNKWRYFCLELSFIGWAILGAFTFGIGLLWLNPYKSAAKAAFYSEISNSYKDRTSRDKWENNMNW
jgi:uncharacterized membrane protein